MTINNSEVVVFGKGYIGTRVAAHFRGCHFEDNRINDQDEAFAFVDSLRVAPKFIINCAGKTGKPNVDWCEDHKEETLFGNVTLPLYLAHAAKRVNATLVHLGSGCIYESGPAGTVFTENDTPNFRGSFYSVTKAMGEKDLSRFDHVLQLRLRMPFDGIPSGRNLITKLLTYASSGNSIVNTPNSLTYIPDLLSAMHHLMATDQKGIYNVVNDGVMTHQEIFAIYNIVFDKNLQPNFIEPQKLDQCTVARRSNCILSCEKLQKSGFHIRRTYFAMAEAFKNYKKANS